MNLFTGIKSRGVFGTLSNIYNRAFCEIVYFQPLTIFVIHFILDVWDGSEYAPQTWASLCISCDDSSIKITNDAIEKK